MGVKVEIERYSGNPILEPNPEIEWMSSKVYNPGVVFDRGVYHMLFRARGKEDGVSRLAYATSKNGIDWDHEYTPVFGPQKSWENGGTEDPRITKIGKIFYMTYTANDNGRTARVMQTSTSDFHIWHDRSLMFPNWHEGIWNDPGKRKIIVPTWDPSNWSEKDLNWSKSAGIFPEKIGGKYWLFFGEDRIWPAFSKDLKVWHADSTPVLQPRKGYFDEAYIEMGPPPIRTDGGWLIIYNGIDRFDNSRVYRIGAALVDLKNVSKVLWRCTEPILEPETHYELSGVIDVASEYGQGISKDDLATKVKNKQTPQAIFCCGAVKTSQNKINLYYGAADRVICLAKLLLLPTTRGMV